ncbi:hypothetical protein O3P69_003706 [Scylla paramamosain]|uniref:Uncharacterized protein n=1 Tax=Scylla paramamosain TaxID=85552 RepID=A0AAW0UD64_SCYPA
MFDLLQALIGTVRTLPEYLHQRGSEEDGSSCDFSLIILVHLHVCHNAVHIAKSNAVSVKEFDRRRTGLLMATESPQQLESPQGVPTCRKAQGKKK